MGRNSYHIGKVRRAFEHAYQVLSACLATTCKTELSDKTGQYRNATKKNNNSFDNITILTSSSILSYIINPLHVNSHFQITSELQRHNGVKDTNNSNSQNNSNSLPNPSVTRHIRFDEPSNINQNGTAETETADSDDDNDSAVPDDVMVTTTSTDVSHCDNNNNNNKFDVYISDTLRIYSAIPKQVRLEHLNSNNSSLSSQSQSSSYSTNTNESILPSNKIDSTSSTDINKTKKTIELTERNINTSQYGNNNKRKIDHDINSQTTNLLSSSSSSSVQSKSSTGTGTATVDNILPRKVTVDKNIISNNNKNNKNSNNSGDSNDKKILDGHKHQNDKKISNNSIDAATTKSNDTNNSNTQHKKRKLPVIF